MNKLFLFSAAIGFILLMIMTGWNNVSRQKTNHDGKATSFAVVELFTSEGCSSCPPADHLLSNIVSDARENNKRVYALAFHVDYWNYLGWKDIYSSASYSRRQKTYAHLLNSHVYTPQMVINGEQEFVGSNRHKADQLISTALGKNRQFRLTIDDIQLADDQNAVVSYSVDQLPENTELNVALVERGLVRHIKRGENSGRTLHHDNVVRAFRSMSLKRKRGTLELQIPADVDYKKATVIGYLQEENGKVIAANGRNIQR